MPSNRTAVIQNPFAIQGRIRVCLRRPGGPTLIVRRASNTVLLSGAELVAALFSGGATTPVNGMAVGVDPTPAGPPYELTNLTTAAADGTSIVDRAAISIPPETLQTERLVDELKVRVLVRAVIPPDRAVSPDPAVQRVLIGEAALGVLAPDGNSLVRIYNRVVFEPVPKTRQHELALYWEVDFPYGV